jgi:translation initiation factor IF-2
VSKAGVIAGSYVVDGTITRAAVGVRVIRDNVVVYQGKLGSLRRFKDDVREVQQGYECGISVENFNDIKSGDIIEAYAVDKIAAKL